MNLQLTTTIKRGENQLAAGLHGEIVMMHMSAGSYYGLNEIGSRIWELLEQPATVGKVCDLLQKEFEVDPATCERDVIEFVNYMVSEGLIDLDNSAAA